MVDFLTKIFYTMKYFYILVLCAVFASCNHDPKLDRAEISIDDVNIVPGQTYELILSSNETIGEPSYLLTSCKDEKMQTMVPATWQHDGQSRFPETFKDEYKIVFNCSDITNVRYTTVPTVLAIVDKLGSVTTINQNVFVPEFGLKPGDVREIQVDGTTYRLIKAKATNAFQLEQGENKIYFILVPRA